ncbi:MAG: hypothetical protein FJY98_03950 [Candidatus Liptonbacteria bacterium]|nr:hypothetical protein [Candidatus Liptonbacteria bacterium]
MAYTTIKPPFSLKYREMSRHELNAYFQWFCDIMPTRIGMLEEVVTQTPGFETWVADQTPQSLDILGTWFLGQVETRPRTVGEQQDLATRSPYPIDIPDAELTNSTFSLAMDIGMYFSQVLRRTHPSLKWEQPLKDKKFADYGQPVLVGFGLVPLNPVRIAVTLAYGFAAKKHSGSRLRELFEYWSSRVGN